MTQTASKSVLPPPFPDHTQLPESEGTFVKNFQEHPQSLIFTDSIGPVLHRLHPDGQYAIVPNVPPKLNGEIRRSYVPRGNS